MLSIWLIPLPDFPFATALFDIKVPFGLWLKSILIIIGMFFRKTGWIVGGYNWHQMRQFHCS
jgi:hypothetical protein